MADPHDLIPSLEGAVRLLAGASSPAEVLDRLAEGSRLGAPRVALVLLRRGRLCGWKCHGHSPESQRALARLDVPLEASWLRRWLAESTEPAPIARLPEDTGPLSGGDPADEALAIPIRAGRGTLGFLIAERSPQDTPWLPQVLNILVELAQVRLDLDLARRRSVRQSEHLGAAARVQESAGAMPGPLVPYPVSSSSPASEETALEPVSEHGDLQPERSRPDDARRFARLVATDIRLYNEEAVISGRRHRDVARRLADQMDRGRESFLRRFPGLGPAGLAILEEAYVEVLAGGDPSLLQATDKDSAGG